MKGLHYVPRSDGGGGGGRHAWSPVPRAALPSSKIGLHCTLPMYGAAPAVLIPERFKNMLIRLKWIF
jgi:hypothetical protein